MGGLCGTRTRDTTIMSRAPTVLVAQDFGRRRVHIIMDDTVWAALLGAAITAAVTLAIFAIDRIVRSIGAFREARRAAFAELFRAVGQFAVAAHTAQGGLPPGPEGPAMIAARALMNLALGSRHRIVGIWMTGMEMHIARAAAIKPQNQQESLARSVLIDQLVGHVFNSLIDLQQHRLFVNDFNAPGAVFEYERRDADYAGGHQDHIEWAFHPITEGRWKALRGRWRWIRVSIVQWFQMWGASKNFVPRPPEPPTS